MKKALNNKQINLILCICSIILLGCFVATVLIAVNNREKQKFVFEKCLENTVVTIDGDDISLREASYYIIKMEAFVDNAAHTYNSENPDDYWNMYINNRFVRSLAKDTVMDTITRDYMYFLEAKESGITLSDKRIKEINDEVYTTLKNMTAEQMNLTDYSETELYEILYRIAMAEEYTAQVSSQDDTLTEEDFNADGSYYEQIYKKHSVKINKNIWDHVELGHITINK